MSIDYALLRVRETLRAPMDMEALPDDWEPLPMGRLDEVVGQLLATPLFRHDPAEEAVNRALAESPLNLGSLPRVPTRSLLMGHGDRERPITVMYDPVEYVWVDHGTPGDLMQVAEALTDLAPFAVMNGNRAWLMPLVGD